MSEKINKLQLRAGIHTVSINSADIPTNIPDKLKNGAISNTSINTSISSGERAYHTKINPNKYKHIINSYSEFEKAINEITKALGISDFIITRVDFCFDNFTEDCYDDHYKLNKCLILLLTISNSIPNSYEAIHTLTKKKLTIKVKTEYFQAEYYDKSIQSRGTSKPYSK